MCASTLVRKHAFGPQTNSGQFCQFWPTNISLFCVPLFRKVRGHGGEFTGDVEVAWIRFIAIKLRQKLLKQIHGFMRVVVLEFKFRVENSDMTGIQT